MDNPHTASDLLPAGLPRVLVDVRHEASHNELPALPLLRLAARQALAWLRAAYWQRQSDHLQHQHVRIVALLQVEATHLHPHWHRLMQTHSQEPAAIPCSSRDHIVTH